MINFLQELLSYEFMRNALLAGVIVSAACGVVGTLVVLNRIVFISGGIAHAAYGGVGIAYFLGLNPVWGAVGFSLLSSLAMGYVHRKEKGRADTIIGVMWALGMALGIIFVSLSPGYKADLMSYLFGSILAVSAADLWLMVVIAVVVLAFVLVFYRLLLAISFDETFSTVRNVPVGLLSMAMIVLIGLTVVISMRVVGLILVPPPRGRCWPTPGSPRSSSATTRWHSARCTPCMSGACGARRTSAWWVSTTTRRPSTSARA